MAARKRGRGQPEKCTKAEVAAAIRKYEGKLYFTAGKLGISYRTLWGYMQKWPELKEIIREAKGVRLDRYEGKADLIAMRIGTRKETPGDQSTLRYLLGTQGKSRGYSERTEVRHGGDAKADPIVVRSEVVMVDELDLPLEVNKMILAKLEERNGRAIANGESASPAGR